MSNLKFGFFLGYFIGIWQLQAMEISKKCREQQKNRNFTENESAETSKCAGVKTRNRKY